MLIAIAIVKFTPAFFGFALLIIAGVTGLLLKL